MEEGFSLRFEGDANACAKWVPFAKKKANQLYDHWKPLGGIGYKVLKVDNDTTIKISVNDFAGTQKTITISSGGIFGWLEMGKLAAGTANTVNRATHEFYPFKKVSKQYSILPRTSDGVVKQAKFYWSGTTTGYLSDPVTKLADGGLVVKKNDNLTSRAHPMCATGILRKLLLLKAGESRKWNGITVGVDGTTYDYGVLRTETNGDFYVAVGRTGNVFGLYFLPVRYSGSSVYKSKGKSYRMISDEMLPAVGTEDWVFVPFTPNGNGAFIENIRIVLNYTNYSSTYGVVSAGSTGIGSTSACWRFSSSGRKMCCTSISAAENSNATFYEVEVFGDGTDATPFYCYILTKNYHESYFGHFSNLTSSFGSSYGESKSFSTIDEARAYPCVFGWYNGEELFKVDPPVYTSIEFNSYEEAVYYFCNNFGVDTASMFDPNEISEGFFVEKGVDYSSLGVKSTLTVGIKYSKYIYGNPNPEKGMHSPTEMTKSTLIGNASSGVFLSVRVYPSFDVFKSDCVVYPTYVSFHQNVRIYDKEGYPLIRYPSSSSAYETIKPELPKTVTTWDPSTNPTYGDYQITYSYDTSDFKIPNGSARSRQYSGIRRIKVRFFSCQNESTHFNGDVVYGVYSEYVNYSGTVGDLSDSGDHYSNYYPAAVPFSGRLVVDDRFLDDKNVLSDLSSMYPITGVGNVEFSNSRFMPMFTFSTSFSEKISVSPKFISSWVERENGIEVSGVSDIQLNETHFHIKNETNEPLPDIQFYPPLLIVGNV